MPCRVEDWERPSISKEKRHGMTIDDFEAVLCGLFTEIEADGELILWLGDINWKEVGVTRRTVEGWWKAHKKEDEVRRARENAEKNKAELKAAALKKLSPEERAALGI